MNYHQGDVLLERIERLPVDAEYLRDEIVQRGELTGHTHRIKDSKIYHSKELGAACVEITNPSPMTHEDHPQTEEIESGVYKVRIQQEYFPEGNQNVKD